MTVAGLLIAGRYRLAEVIGEGGMGVVWRARDEILGREVAVKEIVYPRLISVEEQQLACARSLREARSAARLNHPGVIVVHDVTEHDGRPWIVMELARCGSLADLIAAGPLPPARVAQIGSRILEALSAAHAAGVVHRDVKPNNVLVDGSRIVLTDFGAATIQDDPALTHTGLFIGTPAYLAPERALGARGGPESDLWSLGATLYTAVEGHPPYQGESSLVVLSALLTSDPEPPRRAGPLTQVLDGLLCRDPYRRLNAAQASRMLTKAASGSDAPQPAARSPAPQAPAPQAPAPQAPAPQTGAPSAANTGLSGAGLSGTGLVADDLYLVAHDDRTGKPLLKPRPLGIGLAAALLAELMLADHIGLRRDGVVAAGENLTDTMVASHALLKQIAAEPEPHPVRAWLLFLARGAAEDVGTRLEQAGHLAPARSWVPGRPGRRVPVDPDWAFAPMLRIRSALDPARLVSVHATVLTGLAFACGLGFRLDQYQTPAGRTVEEAVAQLGDGLRELIAQTQAAVDSAILSPRT